jgi:hypothetical protein
LSHTFTWNNACGKPMQSTVSAMLSAACDVVRWAVAPLSGNVQSASSSCHATSSQIGRKLFFVSNFLKFMQYL